MFDRVAKIYRSTFGQALCGAVLLWAALPPLDCWPLAWIAPMWWVMLARRRELVGRRPYRALWIVGFLFWLAAYHFVRFPHPATSIGWIILAGYLGFYLPVFVALVRVAVHRLHVPVILAAPVVWTGLELARAHLITGITMGALGHTQYRWIELIQVSDLAGGYAVCFVVMFVAACLARMLPCQGRPWSLWPLVPAVGLLAAVLVYGHQRLAESVTPSPTLRVALIQGSIKAEFKKDPDRADEIQQHYESLSREAVWRWDDLDLMIWPETMVRAPLLDGDPTNARPPIRWQGSPEEFRAKLSWAIDESRAYLVDLSRRMGIPMLLGVEAEYYDQDGEKHYNSAVLVTPDRALSDRYDKMHCVLFGEFIPLVDRFPWLQDLSPVPVSLTAGASPVAFEVGGVRLAPNICYETVLPHVIRRQVLRLRAEGREPDVLVNLTNDGWFRGSSELDMHLVCSVFRAVECRKPVLIAANTGFSAWIDAEGRIRKQGPRCKTDLLLATVGPDRRTSRYLGYGDIPAGICLLGCLGLAAAGLWRGLSRFSRRGKH